MAIFNKSISIFFCLICFSSVRGESLPEPLSLEYAIGLAEDEQYYQIIEAQASIATAQSELERAESELGFRAQLEVEAAYIEPSRIALDQSANDSRVSLRLTKPLYNFGSSSEKILAAQIEQSALQNFMPFIIGQRKIDIARQFYAVILSDLKYAWDNEAMAIAYVRLESARDRHALSQLSDVELLESENEYMDEFHQRRLSEMDQRHSRTILAELLNRPDELPSNLINPVFESAKHILPDYPVVLNEILQNNPQVKLAEKQVESANQRVSAAGNQFGPRLDAEVEVSEYARTKGSSDEWRAQLNLVIPLYENSSIKTDISIARADWLKKRANLLNIKMKLRKLVLTLWQSVNVLSKRQEQLQTSQEYRELRLDQSRALYEMEASTDLGDSMVAMSEIQYKQAKNNFELDLAKMQLRLLAGKSELLR